MTSCQRRRCLPLFVFVCALNFVVTMSAVENTAVLRVQADSWMPFNGDPAAERPGYAVELLREIFQPLGVTVDYRVAPWTDALKAVEADEIDAVIGANKKEAAKLVVGTEAIAEPKFALFVRADSKWRYESIRSLQDVKLGAIESYCYWDSLDGYLKKATAPAVKLYQGEKPLVDALADLSSGAIDVVAENVVVFYWAAKTGGQKPADFRIAYFQDADPLYVAFAPNEKGRREAEIFDRGMRDLRNSGRFDAIMNRYELGK